MKFIKNHKNTLFLVAVILIGIAVSLAIYSTLQILEPPNRKALVNINHDRGVFADDVDIHDSAYGEILITPHTAEQNGKNEDAITSPTEPAKIISNPEKIWDGVMHAGTFTPVVAVQQEDGSIGVLKIPAIKLSANIYESADNMEAMEKGIAHFPVTSAFDGNVGLSAHNINFDGSSGYFRDIHLLKNGDAVTYITELGTRRYEVSSIVTISETDWSPLDHTDDNRITMITCVSSQPDKRLCVQAVEKRQ